MSGVFIPVEAKLDSGDLDAELSKLTQKINALGQSIAQANKVKFNPIDRATLDDLKRITAQFEAIKRASPSFGQRVAASGQASTPFVDLDWGRMIQSTVAREAQRYGIFTKVMAGTGAGFLPLTPSSPGGSSGSGGSGGGAPPRPPAPPSSPPGPGSTWGGAGRQIVGAGLNAAGPAGQALNAGIGAGMTGGVAAGIAGFVGMLGAALVGKAVGAISDKIGAAATDDIGYDTLKRQLGDVGVSARMLEDAMHAAAGAGQLTYEESRKLAEQFTHLSGVTGNASESLAQETLNSVGFARSFGLDPSQSTGFFARMHQFGATSNDADSRRLALYISEAIAKSGASAKADEILQAIAGYAQQQTRIGLTPANTSGYTDMLAGLVGTHIPGLDPTGAANLLAQANSAIANGGNVGEASQNFSYMALGKRLGLNPIATKMLEEQGAFGTGASTFGTSSMFARWATANGIAMPGAATSGETNLSAIVQAFHRQYANPWLRNDAMARYFGISHSGAMAFDVIGPERLGDLQRTLAGSGVDLTKMSPTAYSALATVATGDRGTLNEQARSLWPRLNKDEERQVDTAARSGDEALRKTLLQLTAKYGQEQTDGSKTREVIADASNKAQDAARAVLHSLDGIRDVLLYAFGDKGRMTAADMHKTIADNQKKAINDRADDRIARARAHFHAHPLDPNGRATMNAEIANANKDRASQLASLEAGGAADAPGSRNTDPIPASIMGGTPGTSSGISGLSNALAKNAGAWAVEAARAAQDKYGVPAAVQLAQFGLESNFGRSGLAQRSNNPFGIHAAAGQDFVWGYDTDAKGNRERTKFRKFSSLAEAFDEHARLLATSSAYAEARKHTDDPMAYAAALTGHYAVDPQYGAKLQAMMRGSDLNGTPIPDTGPAKTADDKRQQWFAFEHNITLQYPNGTPAAAPVTVTKQVGAPSAFGAVQ